MKTIEWMGAALVCLTLAAAAQSEQAKAAGEQIGASVSAITERGLHHRVWSSITWETNRLGHPVAKTNSFTELATGMYFRDASGNWAESKEEFQLAGGRAVARMGAHKVNLPANLNTAGGIELEMPDGKVLRSHVLGLSYFDAASGRSVLIAEVKDCEGELQSSNVVLYADAFTDFEVSVRYTFTRGAFEQDIILVERPPAPEDFGLNPETTRLRVLTEFLDAPQPTKVRRALNAGTVAELAVDDLDFGAMEMGQGKAFSTGDQRQEVPVGRQWLKLAGRDCLVEEVPVAWVAERLKALPAPKRTALHESPRGAWRAVSSQRLLPPQPRLAKSPAKDEIRLAQAAARTDGLVLDYIIVNSQNGYVFRGDETYHVSGNVTLSGTVTFEAGAVLKYSPNCSVTLASGAILGWKGAPYSPVVFTARDDHTIGQAVSAGSLSGYYANPALSIGGGPVTPVLKHFRVAHAAVGFAVGGAGPSFYHGQIVNCANGFMVTGGSANLRNVLFANVQFAFNNLLYASVNAQHATFSSVATLAAGSAQYAGVTVVNSILANVTALGLPVVGGNDNGFFNAPAFGSPQISASVSPFQATVGAGAHYLTETAPFRNVGTTSIDATLLTKLRKTTTSAPLPRVDQTETTSLTLTPVVARDTDALDLGYHYDPIDYLASVWAFENCTLTIRNGTVIAYDDGTGLWLKTGAEIDCEGTPLMPNRFVDYRVVQEQPVKLGSYSVSCGMPINPARLESGTAAPGRFRFAEFSRMARGGYSGYDLYAMSYWKYSTLEARDCVFRGGQVNLYDAGTTAMTLVNNLFEREPFSASGEPTLSLHNNLFKNSACVSFDIWGGNPVVRDNAFDTVLIDDLCDPPLTHSHNAYINCAGRLYPAQSSDKVLGSFAYATGSLGDYYQASTDLINAGSRSAAEADLQYYTIRTSNLREADEAQHRVDIGYHYVALNGSGQPMDTDSDGLPDYADDNSDGDQMSDSWEWKHFWTLSRDGTQDYDNDGTSDYAESQAGTDPNTIVFSVSVANNYTSTPYPVAGLGITRGSPSSVAVLVDSDDFSAATWTDYASPSFAVDLGTLEGWHEVWIGLRGRSTTSEQSWKRKRLKLDFTPPALTLTAPASTTVSQPMIQLQGYSAEDLAAISYDIVNGGGTLTDQAVLVLDRHYELASREFTTATFQAFDVALAAGDNTITLHATDLAGNTSTLTTQLSLVTDTTAPTIQVFWPQDATKVCGNTCTLRGRLDDFTATLTVTIVDEAEVATTLNAVVERDGHFWVEGLPLGEGNNALTLTAADAWDNVTVTSMTVVKGSLNLTIDDIPPAQLWNQTTTVTGTSSSSDHTIWVNGFRAALAGGVWTAENVPINPDGTAVIQARAIPNSDNGGYGTGGSGGSSATYENPGNPDSAGAQDAGAEPEKPEGVYIAGHGESSQGTWIESWSNGIEWWEEVRRGTWSQQWNAQTGGGGVSGMTVDFTGFPFGSSHCEGQTTFTWPPSLSELGHQVTIVSGSGDCEEDYEPGEGPTPPPVICPQHCVANPAAIMHTWANEWETETWYWVWNKGAQTTMKLRTGGKGVPGRRNLWVVTGSASEVLDEWAPAPCALNVPKRTLLPGEVDISIGELGTLGSDGRRYVALPDGVTKDATPSVASVDYYTFDVSATKHKLVHHTQCVALANPKTDRIRLGVGEYVNFSFVPPLAMNPPEQPVWQAFGGTVSPSIAAATTYTAPTLGRKSAVLANVRDAVIVTEFDVVEPTGVDHAVVLRPMLFGGSRWGFAEAWVRVFIAPTDVSFGRVEIQEGEVDATNVSGRYTEAPYDDPENINHDLGNFRAVSCDNRWNPQDAQPVIEGDHLQTSMVPPYEAGGYTWPIPAYWRIPGGPTHPLSSWSPQVVTVDNNGTTRITKFGLWVERTVNDVYTIGP